MTLWRSIDTVLDYAIDNEASSAQFYRDLAHRAATPELRDVLEGYAREELSHKQILEQLKRQKQIKIKAVRGLSLEMKAYAVEGVAAPDMEVEEALALALARENAAFRLYRDLADEVADPKIRNVFLRLAEEEAKHKTNFEQVYAERVGDKDRPAR